MKRLIVAALLVGTVLAAIVSCASFPKPQADTDTLVVGSVILDFPDGFFSEPATKIDSGLRLDFQNLTTKKDFTLVTGKGGYFYFLSNGSDTYQITDYAYQVSTGRGYYHGSARVGIKFKSESGCVQYLGHLAYRFTSPTIVTARGTGTTTWHFVTDSVREYKKDEVQSWLQASAPDSPWLPKEIRPDFQK